MLTVNELVKKCTSSISLTNLYLNKNINGNVDWTMYLSENLHRGCFRNSPRLITTLHDYLTHVTIVENHIQNLR